MNEEQNAARIRKQLSDRHSETSVFLDLKGITSLKVLPLEFPETDSVYLYNSEFPDLTPLTGLPHLKDIHLSLESDVDIDLAPLAAVSNLKEFTLSIPGGVVDLSFLDHLDKLTQLTLSSHFEQLARLNLKHLDYLSLDSASLESLESVSHLTTVTYLSVGDQEGRYSEGSEVKDISPLANLINLKYLDLENGNITDVKPLSNLKKLKRLQLTENKELSDISPLAGLPDLEELHLNDTALADPSPLRTCPKLRILRMRGTKLKDLNGLKGFDALEFIYLEESTLESVEGAMNLPNLRTLWIWGSQVKDISPLKDHPTLDELNIAGLGKLKGVEIVPSLKKLKTIDVGETVFDPSLLSAFESLDEVLGSPYPPDGVQEFNLSDPPLPGPGLDFTGRFGALAFPAEILDIDVSHNGELLVVATRGESYPEEVVSKIQVFHTADAKLVYEYKAPAEISVCGVVFGAENEVYFALHESGEKKTTRLHNLNLETGQTELLDTLAKASAPYSAHMRLTRTPDSRYIALQGSRLYIWDIKDKTRIRDIKGPGEDNAISACFMFDNKRIYLHGREAQTITLYDFINDQDVLTLKTPLKGGGHIQVSGDGQYLGATGCNNYKTTLLDAESGERLLQDEIQSNLHDNAFALTNRGNLLIRPTFCLLGYRLPEGKAIREGPKNPTPARSWCNITAQSKDSSLVAFASINTHMGDYRVLWTFLREV